MQFRWIAATIAIITVAAWAMPPAPGVLERIADEGRLTQFRLRMADARARGVNAPFDFKTAEPLRDGADERIVRALCILVDFEDNEANRNGNSAERFQEMLFSVGEYRTGSMRDWYLENSYGNIDIQGLVVGWYRMPHTYDYYVQGQNGFGNFPRNAQGLVRDALAAANDDVDFREFDNDNDRTVEALFVVHAGPGAEATGNEDQIWSHAGFVPENITFDGMRFARYAMEPEDGKIGVFGHELGHSYFGLPDLYDTDYSSAGVGMWSMMAGGAWGGGGERPVHFDPWCKYRIGVIDPIPVVQNQRNLVLPPVELEPEVLMLWREDDWNNEFFLLENRARIGYDTSMPGQGVMIWHIDEDKRSNSEEWYPGENPNAHYLVAVEQADGNWDLEHNSGRGDGGDPFPGETWNGTFSTHTTPDSRDYGGRATNVTVYNIEAVDSVRYRINIALDPDWEPEALNLFVLNRIPPDHRYPDPDRRDGALTDEVRLVRSLFRQAGVWDYQIGSELPQALGEFNTILYLESWREGDVAGEGLTLDEQTLLAAFLSSGRRLVLVGPDVAGNIARTEDSPLWPMLSAELLSEGVPAEENQARIITGNEMTRIAGQSFPIKVGSPATHYLDEVQPAAAGAKLLFRDNRGAKRGVIFTSEDGGYRVIIQPFLFGALVDWGGRKSRLMELYFNYMQFALAAPPLAREAPPPRVNRLIAAWPNPFNGALTISTRGLSLGTTLKVTDLLGREVGMISVNAPSQTISWQPSGIAPGIYWLFADGEGGGAPVRVVYLK